MSCDGYSKAYQRKLVELKEWDNEQNENMKKFVRDYKKYLNQNFNSHQKRQKSELKLRELKFNSTQKS